MIQFIDIFHIIKATHIEEMEFDQIKLQFS